MLKIRTQTKDGRLAIILGLSAENIRRLQADQPIHFDLDTLGIEGVMTIISGDTEDSMKETLTQAGMEFPDADS